MRGLVLISVLCMQLTWSYGVPSRHQGVGAYAYQDSSGNSAKTTRSIKNPFRSPFGPPFRRSLTRRAFGNQLEQQNLALIAARKAYDLTSNRAAAGYFPYFDPIRFSPFGDAAGFDMPGFGMPNFMDYPNSASAFAAAGPGYQRHNIAINPRNPNKPNVNVMNFGEKVRNNKPDGFYSVSSSSYSSSSNVNGEEKNVRGGETVINDNGKVTAYRLNN